VETPRSILAAIALGLALGVSFNPFTSVAGASLAAAVYGSPKAGRDRRLWWLAILLIAWLLGDGLRVMARVRDAVDLMPASALHSPGASALWWALAVWALAGLLLGYVLPAALGSYAGHRVTHGTGWLSAIAVAVTASLALSAIAAPLSVALQRLAR
jgi:hypothetical protein